MAYEREYALSLNFHSSIILAGNCEPSGTWKMRRNCGGERRASSQSKTNSVQRLSPSRFSSRLVPAIFIAPNWVFNNSSFAPSDSNTAAKTANSSCSNAFASETMIVFDFWSYRCCLLRWNSRNAAELGKRPAAIRLAGDSQICTLASLSGSVAVSRTHACLRILAITSDQASVGHRTTAVTTRTAAAAATDQTLLRVIFQRRGGVTGTAFRAGGTSRHRSMFGAGSSRIVCTAIRYGS